MAPPHPPQNRPDDPPDDLPADSADDLPKHCEGETSAPLNLFEYQEAARRKLPRSVYDYYAGGSWDEVTLRRNRSCWHDLTLRYRVLRDVEKRDSSTTVLGQTVSSPVLIAPTAFQCMAHPDGEVATARAAAAVGTIMILSTLSNRPVEEVTTAASAPVWFQLYVYRDRGATRAVVERAEAAGCRAIVLTVDAQIWGHRERDARSGFRLPQGLRLSNLVADARKLPQNLEGSALAAYVGSMFDPSLCWKDVEWLRSVTRLPVVLKGIVHPDDARRAAREGVDAIVVSNHGGRQVDTAPATIEVLPQVVEAVDGACEILIDGGVRRGSDVVKALALGARAVAVGRPVLWGLAVAGQSGVEHVLTLLAAELDAVMGLCGATSPRELDRDLVSGIAPTPAAD